LAQRIGRHGHRAAQTTERAGKGKQQAQAGSSGFEPGKSNFGGGGKGKLLSPARRRECVQQVRETTQLSERKVCAAVGQNRATQQYASSVNTYSVLLRQAVINYASEYGRYGYSRECLADCAAKKRNPSVAWE